MIESAERHVAWPAEYNICRITRRNKFNFKECVCKVVYNTVRIIMRFHKSYRLQNSRIFCERERRCRSIFERKVWSECKNGEGEWGDTLKTTFLASHALRACEARATLEDHAEARATLEDHAYGASRLPKPQKTTVLQSTSHTTCHAANLLRLSP